ncbi:pilus assembly PilX N-terminal domain-containing protein [Oceanobacillus locisalsi]|uniref:Pilus assembly PilX N-terminal domain-containing protein n=1 Tax=Oceanobacillus locisalsi TaxID=546107 RepID=A0ABW3NG73_9BACI
MKKWIKNQYISTNESGYMLVTVVLIITIIAILGVSIISMTLNSVKTSTREQHDQSAFYIAEAGLTVKMEEVKQIIDNTEVISDSSAYFENLFEAFEQLDKEYNQFEMVSGISERPYAAITIEEVADQENTGTYVMTSAGHIGTNARKLEQTFEVNRTQNNEGSIPEMAVLVQETIYADNGTITGDIGTVMPGDDTMVISREEIVNGDYFAPRGSEARAAKILNRGGSVFYPGANDIAEKGGYPELPPFPDIPAGYSVLPDTEVNGFHVVNDGSLLITDYRANNYTLNMDDNLAFKNMAFNANRVLNIHTGDSDKAIVVDHLDMENGHINITGTGKLTIYVTDRITFGSGSTINNHGDVKQLDIFLEGNQELKLAGSQTIFGSVYAENGEIDLGAGAGVKGNIFSGGNHIKISGGSWAAPTLIFAPNAEVSLTGGAAVRGAIIAHSYHMSGGATMIWEELQYTEGPISSGGISGDVEEVQLELSPVYESESVE